MRRLAGATVLAGVVVVVASCGAGHRAPARQLSPTGAASLCRDAGPWTSAARRRCEALVFRWSPVHSVRLTTRLSPRVLSTCEQARRQTRIPVVCPPLVPTGGVVADRGLYGFEGPPSAASAGDFYLLTFNNGENRGHIHWIVGAGRGHTVRRSLFDPRRWDVPGRVRRLGERRYGPWAIAFYRFPAHPSGGPLGGHDVALAALRGTTYFATIHGHTHRDADAAMLIAILLAAGAPGS